MNFKSMPLLTFENGFIYAMSDNVNYFRRDVFLFSQEGMVRLEQQFNHQGENKILINEYSAIL